MKSDSAPPRNVQESAEAESTVAVSLREEVLDALDEWIAARPEPRPSRQDAIRDILSEGLQARAEGTSARSS